VIGLRVSGLPFHAMGALIEGAGGAVVSETVAVVAQVIVVGVVGWEGNHPMASSPHGFDLEENLFLVRVKRRGRGETEWVDMVDSYSEDEGEQASANSQIYLSMSWRNSNLPSWYMVMIRDLSTLWMISVVLRREKERGDIPERRGRRQEFWRNTCLRA
jgi:hypothetical protein